MKTRTIMAMFGIGLWFSTVTTATSPSEQSTITEKKNRIQYEMAKIRLRLLEENQEFRELNQRIITLQKVLMKRINAHPDMRALAEQLEKIDTSE